MPLHIETPFVRSQALSRRLGSNVLLKMEAMQPGGSFKLRGVGAVCEAQAAVGARRFVSSSGGNAGIAVAYCGRELRVPVVVVVPESTSQRARDLIRLEGAELIVHGTSWAEANDLARSLTGPQDAFVHPFDDPVMWSGHATMVDEMAASGPKPDAVVLAVGGGGLLCGVLEGLWRNGWSDIPVFAVETEGTDCYTRSVAQGRPVELAAISSVATSLGAKRPCDHAVEWAAKHAIHNLVVSDTEAVAAALQFLDDHRVVVEPACGAALAALNRDHPVLRSASSIAVIVCGGATTSVDQLRALDSKTG
ncbi:MULTISPECIES: pyridoxal-phosphate dependent enzyme [Ralstonia solanacearum species complex]|uniref:pyridoxal-phosphate dependent enzyme n=1 Tax=Ralstonia solanacearum species complex TaxID=3116862 RepID=UPI000E56E84C|nr:pyridoxal-phosphate dependent enzyme [Ralstonia solanacearum]BEU73669.1 threonine/serine dehydratase [Ralstonia pseudosolanacearum]AXV78622.1 serine dehydratase [Ralstonia solanacearum]AXV92640.1 serine dehydratase [Ralstonia solanacearum]AXW20724.1 serine dehydratase [Ralstonia solanacearum]AXW77537.1 serine dehydratase [Ralstonia solanacearum]